MHLNTMQGVPLMVLEQACLRKARPNAIQAVVDAIAWVALIAAKIVRRERVGGHAKHLREALA
jgi:hypothetical protein